MGALTKNSSALYRAIREKEAEITERSGPMLDGDTLARELGVKDKRTAIRWAQEHDIPAVPVGRRRQYETRLVSQVIVQTRGMI